MLHHAPINHSDKLARCQLSGCRGYFLCFAATIYTCRREAAVERASLRTPAANGTSKPAGWCSCSAADVGRPNLGQGLCMAVLPAFPVNDVAEGTGGSGIKWRILQHDMPHVMAGGAASAGLLLQCCWNSGTTPHVKALLWWTQSGCRHAVRADTGL